MVSSWLPPIPVVAHSNAYVSSNLNNDGYNYFEIENVTINNYNSYTHTTGNGAYFSDSATGECTLEHIKVGDGLYQDLAEFNPNGGRTEEFDSCEIIDRNGVQKSVGGWPNRALQIWVGSTELAYPGSLFNGGQDFLVYWRHA